MPRGTAHQPSARQAVPRGRRPSITAANRGSSVERAAECLSGGRGFEFHPAHHVSADAYRSHNSSAAAATASLGGVHGPGVGDAQRAKPEASAAAASLCAWAPTPDPRREAELVGAGRSSVPRLQVRSITACCRR